MGNVVVVRGGAGSGPVFDAPQSWPQPANATELLDFIQHHRLPGIHSDHTSSPQRTMTALPGQSVLLYEEEKEPIMLSSSKSKPLKDPMASPPKVL